MEITMHKGQFGNPALIEFVLGYEVIRFVFSRNVALPVYHHTPLPQQSLTFYPREPQRFRRGSHPPSLARKKAMRRNAPSAMPKPDRILKSLEEQNVNSYLSA